MKWRCHDRLATIVFAALLLAISASRAQTVSSGPYYATPSWDQKLQCDTQATCPRFIVLSNWSNAAVLDRETGLVWERSPLSPCTDPMFCKALEPGNRTWPDAQEYCIRLNVSNRGGWRLPTLQELLSLVDLDPAITTALKLPPGHPFTGVVPNLYWSATSTAATDVVWTVDPFFGQPVRVNKANPFSVWCVRSGQPGSDPQ